MTAWTGTLTAANNPTGTPSDQSEGGARPNPTVQVASFVSEAQQNIQSIGNGLRSAGMPEQQVQQFIQSNSPQQMMAALDPSGSGSFSAGGGDDEGSPPKRRPNPDDTDTA